mmetsp:Transcript_16084/g.40507  ORF Transcript_16084/g.40507 Transcript_16084/m.40507 type:complete len:103 (-) Transcript_16084:9-317(-)
MQLFLRNIAGDCVPLAVEAAASVADLKAAVEDATFIPADLQRLMNGGHQLVSRDVTLADLGLEDGDTVSLLLDVKGGMRAKWRKKRMRRLRRKRRKMRQRAR